MAQLYDFVKESNRIKGILRPPTDTELGGHNDFLLLAKLTVPDVEMLVSRVQPGAILRRQRGNQLRGLLERASDFTGNQPFEIHVWYETLHPFTDGNGRSGRAIWLWMMKQRGELDRALAIGFLHNWYYQSLQAQR